MAYFYAVTADRLRRGRGRPTVRAVRTDPAPARVQRAPATRDQVDAHRFGVRRMEAALVRADPVLLHEQIRSQRRAVFAGVLVGLLALGVAALLARVDPATDWRSRALVQGQRSGVLYAVVRDPDRSALLVPVPDPVAGRLVLAAHGRDDGATAVPVPVPDDALAAAPRTAPAAVPGTVGVPLDGVPVPPAWAVCDTRGEGSGAGTTTVLAGSLGPVPAGPEPVALLAAEGGATYLVHDGARHRLDPSDRNALDGLGLFGAPVRRVGDGLLSAIPEGAPLRVPAPGPTPVAGLGRNGDVVRSQSLGAGSTYFLVVDDGLARIPVTLADAVRSRTGQAEPATLPPGLVDDVGQTRVPGAEAWPAARAEVTEVPPVLCGTWREGRRALVAGIEEPVAPGAVRVRLAGADDAGPGLDAVVLPGTGPGPLRTGPVDTGGGDGGTRLLLAASGAVHGVADAGTGRALGIGEAGDAPAEMVRLLPRAGVLSVAAAREVADLPG
ncbi:type VII secretion protein EccB [Pseudonocardia alni]|uniref:Type VII secretion protein EccB n=1 Tax=Pseudonocardia alni TaxID=33907 RepID=A0AA44UP12_PSEA5|nr:type VII secretion protein EccB [Pseudonocardia alni]